MIDEVDGELAEITERRAKLGDMTVPYLTPAEFGRFIDSEIAKWAPVVKASGAKVD